MEGEFSYYKGETRKPVEPKKKPVEIENEAEAQAKSKSLAVNVNWNILYYPGDDADGLKGAKGDPLKDPGFTPKDIIEKFFKEEEQEALAAAKAKSEAEIKNKNINIVIQL